MKMLVVVSCCCLLLAFNAPLMAGETVHIPVQGMVTMVDLGADRCVPCKMMAPIIAKVKKDYEGRAAIIFLDVWKDAWSWQKVWYSGHSHPDFLQSRRQRGIPTRWLYG